MTKRKIDFLLDEYGESHQTSFNQKIHFICVPAIFLSLIGLLATISITDLFDISDQQGFSSFFLNFAHIGSLVILFGLIYYLRLSFALFIGMLVFSLIVLFVIRAIEIANIAPLWAVMLTIFVIAWIGQFIGHKHEGKKPSFFKDVQFLMIGPAWTLSHFFKAMNMKF